MLFRSSDFFRKVNCQLFIRRVIPIPVFHTSEPTIFGSRALILINFPLRAGWADTLLIVIQVFPIITRVPPAQTLWRFRFRLSRHRFSILLPSHRQLPFKTPIRLPESWETSLISRLVYYQTRREENIPLLFVSNKRLLLRMQDN